MAEPPDEYLQARRARLLFATAIAGIVLYIILEAIAQSLHPYYSPIGQAESDLAVGPYGYVMTLNFVNRGVLSLCFLFALALSANSADTTGSRFRKGGYLFAVWCVGALLLAVFPTDVPATPISWHGAIHLVVAILAFFGGAFGALFISLEMAKNSVLRKARVAALPLAALTVVLFVMEVLGGPIAPVFYLHSGGLIERLFLASELLWIGAVSVTLILRPGPRVHIPTSDSPRASIPIVSKARSNATGRLQAGVA